MSVNLPSAAQHGEMCTSSLSAEQQRDLATRITTFLSMYSHLSDSYIIEFFTEDLWSSLPSSWRAVLRDLKYPQIADLLLGASHADRRYPSVWPLSLLAFRATAQALAFPRESREGGGGAEEFQYNESQSSLLRHIFRKHVKPKKQHEIRKLGALVKELCDQTDCSSVVDVGSGQGHLTRFLSFGLGLSVTAIEADRALLAMATKFDGELLGVLEKEREKQNERLQEAMLQSSEFGYPMSSWVGGLPGHQLSYKAREAACHALEDYRRRLWEESQLLRTHCYRATLETFIREQRPELRRAGVQTVKKAHLLTFTEYARLGLARVGLPTDLPLDGGRVEAMLEQQGRVVVFFSLALLLAPVVETLVLLDRIIYLQENGVDSRLVPLFDPNLSPRNFVLVALKARGHGGAKRKS
ncbi:methyltransferase-like protein 25B isoform X2 [Pseudochaenichthys georgianus]|uniref:methyltransferase-like protein 25B isoform X2 n=1 Tax=Pseudochaenichthys georgianus TaxID=52239 RepID=UPI0039C3B17E